jgi:hypothetical protein
MNIQSIVGQLTGEQRVVMLEECISSLDMYEDVLPAVMRKCDLGELEEIEAQIQDEIMRREKS